VIRSSVTDAVNVGIAVAVEGGLLTVVNRNTDQQPLRAISADVKRMAAGAREGKVRPDDIEGSTFSISNLGMFDVENFSAIINPPRPESWRSAPHVKCRSWKMARSNRAGA
jgi:pyruvate/2-oxoglutarate dehydrogenase complex dihydrolipoamide acyltransferase (E2) component